MSGQALAATPMEQDAFWLDALCLALTSLHLPPSERVSVAIKRKMSTHPSAIPSTSAGANGGQEDDSTPPPAKIFKYHRWSGGRKVAVAETSVRPPRQVSFAAMEVPNPIGHLTSCQASFAFGQLRLPEFRRVMRAPVRQIISTTAQRRQPPQEAPLDFSTRPLDLTRRTAAVKTATKRKAPGSAPSKKTTRPPPNSELAPSTSNGARAPPIETRNAQPTSALASAAPQRKRTTVELVIESDDSDEPASFSDIPTAIVDQQPPRMTVLWNNIAPSPTAPAYRSEGMHFGVTRRNQTGPLTSCEFCRMYCGSFAHKGDWKRCPYPYHCPDEDVHAAFTQLFLNKAAMISHQAALVDEHGQESEVRGYTFGDTMRPTLSSFPQLKFHLVQRDTSTFDHTLDSLAAAARPLMMSHLRPLTDAWGKRSLRIPVEPLTLIAPTMTGFEMSQLISRLGAENLVQDVRKLKNYYMRWQKYIADLTIVSVIDEEEIEQTVYICVVPKPGTTLEFFASLYQLAIQSPHIDSLVPYLTHIGSYRGTSAKIVRTKFGDPAPHEELLLERHFLPKDLIARKIIETFLYHPPGQLPKDFGYCAIPFATVLLCFPGMVDLTPEEFDEYLEYYFTSFELNNSFPRWEGLHEQHPLRVMISGVYKKIREFKLRPINDQRAYLKAHHHGNTLHDPAQRQPPLLDIDFDVPEVKLACVSRVLYLAVFNDATSSMALAPEEASWICYLNHYEEMKANMPTVDSPTNPQHKFAGDIWHF